MMKSAEITQGQGYHAVLEKRKAEKEEEMNKATPEEKKRLISNQKIMDKNKELIDELREWERKNEEWMEEGHKSRRMPQHLMRIKRLTATMDALIEKGLPLKAEKAE